MIRQQELLIATAKRHGLTIGQAEEIWNLFGEKINTVISSNKKDEEGQFILDKFDTVHIDNFGKFVPNKRKVNYANHCIKLKQQK
jgi:nucleoid DNA-binding protein